MIMEFVSQLENANKDAILDLGLSKFAHREKFRQFARDNNFEIKIHYLDVPKKTRLKRVMKRNNVKGDTFEFEVSQDSFEFMENWFEKPSLQELTNGIVIRE